MVALVSKEGKALPSKIRLNLHWIHSRIKFLQDIMRISEIALVEENQEKSQLLI
jgi:hypothetical protein